jgi:quercetin dioxygenase-like cupin family protein
MIRINLLLFLISASFVLLLGSCESPPTIPDPLEAGWNGQSVCEVLEDNANVRVLRCTFPPGVGHEWHQHQPHFGYTITGSTFRITDSTGTREVGVPSGYSFSKDVITQHEVLNVGQDTGVFLIVEYK